MDIPQKSRAENFSHAALAFAMLSTDSKSSGTTNVEGTVHVLHRVAGFWGGVVLLGMS
jgi:hypothetical protein